MSKVVKIVTSLLLVMFLTNCAHDLFKDYSASPSGFFEDYEELMLNFNREFGISMQLRQEAISFYNQEKAEGKYQFFTATDIRDIHLAIDNYINNRNFLLENIVYKYKGLIEKTELIIRANKPTEQVDIDTFNNETPYVKRLYINPNDALGRDYIKAIKLALAASLTLYDNFIIAIMPYDSNGAWRRKINYDNIDNAKSIEDISRNFADTDNYVQALRVSRFFKEIQNWENTNPKSILVDDTDNEYFNVIVKGSFTFNNIEKITLDDRMAYEKQRVWRIFADSFINAGSDLSNTVSQLFGNTVGLISSRSGYLKNIPNAHKHAIQNALQPGDILLEKTPFRYTDQFIPGHWGHVAIWVGNKQQLENLGVWQLLPELYENAQKRFNYKGLSFQSLVLKNKRIVEALRSGVQANTLNHFLNIDDLAVLRAKKVSNAKLKEYLIKTFEQIGKKYDFNFDVETDTTIVCSELAYVAYHDYDWRVEKTLGRYTISPDNIAEKVGDDQPLKVVMLYHDGKKVADNKQRNFLDLMNGKYNQIRLDLVAVK